MKSDLHHRKALGPQGKRIHLQTQTGIDIRYSLTLLTSLSDTEPLYVSLRRESNSQWDFLNFLNTAIESGKLKSGDVLVLDNASVHVGQETTNLVFDLLSSYNVYLLFLPAYSPELNPCEFVFSHLKGSLRKMSLSPTLIREIVLALGEIDHQQLLGFYKKCIWSVTD